MSTAGPPDSAVTGLAEDLGRLLGPEQVTVDARARRVASTDWAHLSPVLSARLPAGLADVVAYPGSADDVAEAVAAAHRRQIPITVRGQGTGNYGQAIPLRGGLVVDVTRARRILDVSDGLITAEAGASFVAMEGAARRTGQELAMMPSTVGSTIGGFLAGGAGGTGSVEHGFVWDGFVAAIDLVPCTDEARPITVAGAATRTALHAYGTTGVIARASVRLRPARQWTALFASFAPERWVDAVAAGRGFFGLDPVPRLVNLDEPELVGLLASDQAMPAGRVSLRAIVAQDSADAACGVVDDHGGRVEEVRAGAAGYLTSLSFNHVTHRARRIRPELAHMQLGGDLTELPATAREVFDRPLLHLDALRFGMHVDADGTGHGGAAGFGGLLLAPYTTTDALYAGMDALRAVGVRVVDPHTWMLSEGLDDMRAAAARFDPDGLLNPGKLPAVGPTPTADRS